MNKERFKNYVIDSIILLKQLAKKAKAEADNSTEENRDYNQGVIMGYYSIFTLLKHEAFAFCIDQKELGLADVNPDTDLLGLGRNLGLDVIEDNWAIDVINEEKIKGYFTDSINLLKEQAKEAKKEADNPKEGFENYSKGELMAYSLLFSLLKHQASLFQIDVKEIGLVDLV